jgi:dihydroorotase
LEVIRRTTLNPAKVLRAELEIGTLEPGTRADVTVLDRLEGAWPLKDGLGETLVARERLMPRLVLRAGVPHVPHNRLLTDLTGRMLPLAA